ncbi:hypothetical protein HYC85_005843 [Camellia sinensis]|uniref:F-box domain-containing protein n=1 Tax=Camellia sinensis TaxID=4442 RepID=A0A7J7I391_CAMSI|nr:hypothetical protein HYC85_005843 [Camellia sinensis]
MELNRISLWMNYFPDEVLDHVFDFLTSHRDRNAVSVVCKSWHRVESCEGFTTDGLAAIASNCRLNHAVPLATLQKIVAQAPQLVDLGTGAFVHDLDTETRYILKSGFLEVAPRCLPAIYPICSNLTSLNLSYAPGIHGSELIKLIGHCSKLQRLWILDCIGDLGLGVVASTCRELQELRVFPSDLHGVGHAAVTEEGLVAISAGCPKLHSLLYFCQQMTNAALITVAKNCPNFTRFRLCILNPTRPDPVTMQPLDEGFGAVVQSCKGLKRLSLSGLLTDQVFLYIGMYAEQLRNAFHCICWRQ